MELVLALVTLVGLLAWRKRRTARKPRDRPDPPLAFAGGLLGYRELMANCLVTGATGSGKSSAMAALLRELLADGCGMYLPAGKPGDAQRYAEMARRAGRTDVVLFDSTCRSRVNFLDGVLGTGDDATLALQAEAAFTQLGQALNAAGGGGREDDQFWATNTKRWVRMGFRLILAAGERPSIPLLVDVVTSSAASPAAVGTEAFRAGTCFKLLARAADRLEHTPRRAEYMEIENFWLLEVPNTADRQRSGFVAGILGPADVLAAGIPKAILCSDSNVDPAQLVARNAVVITDFPLGDAGVMCPVINTALKYAFQRAILRRAAPDGTRPFILAIDEYQTQASEFDAEYLSLCRSARGPMVLMTQGYESLMMCFPGPGAEHKVNVLAGNCAIRMFMSPTPTTGAWLTEKLLGQRVRLMLGGSASAGGYESPWDLIAGSKAGSAAGSFQQQYVPWLTPGELAALRTGGAENGRWVDFVVTIAGRRFAGRPFTVASVRQEGK
ncbi:Uncharacterized protein OS=Blastopirellula marina DSM 3645 GN=DSM3645_27838 PE=4 SV=1: FtsK_SpoIIIE [Gemmata massiliana]|uniref:TraD/TraG TraM recognition site domain-containing protein n=1 Tax=Gemmata massiliana TaxID=1210884 RepID=A0A6P2DH75_9BACT|nr:hypothetical protein [Gemmata massiliana]VTS00402.1 Uncharacterized protein OS=Blastopirellula marina DSM 3645 GN=DSM3645_27838 PE=4 SV=1: FtsK_SpoIIIE [Gemmata massiliana]